MFESLSEKLQNVFKKLRSKGGLTQDEVNEALREVRLVLLEADVNYKVVKGFIATLKERAVGAEILKSLTPGQQVIKLVREELVRLLGAETETGHDDELGVDLGLGGENLGQLGPHLVVDRVGGVPAQLGRCV